jgi:hypothetical protein
MLPEGGSSRFIHSVIIHPPDYTGESLKNSERFRRHHKVCQLSRKLRLFQSEYKTVFR